MYEELRKRRVDMSCMQVVRWEGHGGVLWVLRDKVINCRGQEMMLDLKGLESW